MKSAMRRVALVGIAICMFAALAGQASAAKLMEGSTTAFQAIYGSPSTTTPVGGGLGRNFGFGANLLFQATTTAPEAAVELTFSEGPVTLKSEDAYFAGTVQSNTTGANKPLGMAVQFADFQKAAVAGTAAPWFSDTSDRPWIATVCSPLAAAEKCTTDPLFNTPVGSIKIENVSVDFGPGTVVQGTMWGKWTNGTTTTPPCITFESRPSGSSADQGLIVTQSEVFKVGATVTAVAGKACLISADNYYGGGATPEVKIANE